MAEDTFTLPIFSADELSFLLAGKAAVAPGGTTYSCIDPDHGPHVLCECMPPPPAGSEERFVLRGVPGRCTGESRLRSQLSGTAQWNSPQERLALAQSCESTLPALAKALKTRKLASLHKGDMLHLARSWALRSDIWVRKGSEGRRREAAPSQQVAVVPAGLRRGKPPCDLSASPAMSAQMRMLTISGSLVPALNLLATRVACCFAGERGASILSHHVDLSQPALLDRLVSAEGKLERQAVLARAQFVHNRVSAASRTAALDSASMLAAGTELQEPVWRMLARTPGVATESSALPLIREFAYTLALFLDSWERRWRSDSPGGALTEAQTVTLEELQVGVELALEWVSRADALVAQARMRDWGEYLQVQAAVLGAAEFFTATANAGNARRKIFSFELLRPALMDTPPLSWCERPKVFGLLQNCTPQPVGYEGVTVDALAL